MHHCHCKMNVGEKISEALFRRTSILARRVFGRQLSRQCFFLWQRGHLLRTSEGLSTRARDIDETFPESESMANLWAECKLSFSG